MHHKQEYTMRPYNIRNLIVVTSVSATITVLVLKAFGYLQLGSHNSSSEVTSLTTIGASKDRPSSLPSGESATKLTCLNGYSLLQPGGNTATTLILADQHGLPIKCQ
jgi:hypothetical protein